MIQYLVANNMDASITINQTSLNFPVFEKPQALVKLQNGIDRIGLEYLNFQMAHPIYHSLLRIAGGVSLVAALNATPSHIDLSESAQHISQGFNNLLQSFQPQDVHAAGLNEQMAQTGNGICGMPDTLTIHDGDTFYSVVRNAIKAQGITGSAEIKDYYQQIVDYNETAIPDPANVRANTVVNIPQFAGCDAASQTIAPEAVTNAVGAVESLNTAVCGMPGTLTIHDKDTFYSVVRDAIKARGITDSAETKLYYQQIIEFNKTNIPDPANVAAGTTVNIPDFAGCDPRQIVPDVVNQGVLPGSNADPQALVGGETPKTPQPDVNGTIGLVVMGIVTAIIGGGVFAVIKGRKP
jgi:hypothetical protein